MEPFNLLLCLISKSRFWSRRFKRLKEKRFIELLQKEEGKLYRIAFAILGQEADAWDVLQETTEKAWLQRKSLRGGDYAFPAWIRRILINQSINVLRKHEKTVLIDPSSIPELSKDWQETNLGTLDVWEVVKSLDILHRQVVVLRYLGDLSLKEIAIELELPLGTVKSRLNRALVRLRETIEENDLRRKSL